MRGIGHPHWQGGRITTRQGYVKVRVEGRYVLEHILIAEAALGKPLPASAVVHHVNEDKADNSRGNHVICDSQAYHVLLHARARALAATGDANWRMCCRCRRYDDPPNLAGFKMHGEPSTQLYHAACQREYTRRHPRRDRARAEAA